MEVLIIIIIALVYVIFVMYCSKKTDNLEYESLLNAYKLSLNQSDDYRAAQEKQIEDLLKDQVDLNNQFKQKDKEVKDLENIVTSYRIYIDSVNKELKDLKERNVELTDLLTKSNNDLAKYKDLLKLLTKKYSDIFKELKADNIITS